MCSPLFFFVWDHNISNTIAGLLSALCLPVNDGEQFVGVVCNDFRLDELLSEVTYLHEGDLIYAFAIDGYGRTLVHPLLPQRRGGTDIPEVIGIGNFETAVGVEEVITSMKKSVF